MTTDLAQRLDDHNSGVSTWTKHPGPWQLIFFAREFPTVGEARKFENLLKRQKGGRGFYRLTGIRSGSR
jgi:putative endonuclease